MKITSRNIALVLIGATLSMAAALFIWKFSAIGLTFLDFVFSAAIVIFVTWLILGLVRAELEEGESK